MMESSQVERWDLGIRVLHWLTVAALVAQVGIAFGLMGGPGIATILWLPLHMSIGATIFCVVLLRLGWRAFTRPPLRRLSPPLRRLSIFIHANLYALVLAVGITGWMAYRPLPLMPGARLFGNFPVPLAPSVTGIPARDFAAAHSVLVWVLLAVVAVHVVATLTHAAALRDGTMSGMLFGRSRTHTSPME